MVNLPVRSFFPSFKKHPFMVDSQQRFTTMLLMAIVFHVFLLLSCQNTFMNVLPIKKMMATLLEVSLLPDLGEANSTSDLKENAKLQPVTQGPMLASQILGKTQESKPTHVRKRTISAASHKSTDAAYLARWQSYVEKFGNSHYPEVALKLHLQGDIRLLVAVNKDGSLHEVKIRQSSGSTQLDEAAVRLVYASAPFEPLPIEISEEAEILEIIRTWQFRGTLSTS